MSHKGTTILMQRLKRSGIKFRTGAENVGMVHYYPVGQAPAVSWLRQPGPRGGEQLDELAGTPGQYPAPPDEIPGLCRTCHHTG